MAVLCTTASSIQCEDAPLSSLLWFLSVCLLITSITSPRTSSNPKTQKLLAAHMLAMLHCVIYVLSHYFSRFLGEKQGHAAWRHHPAGAFLKKQIHQADLPSRCGNGNASGRRSLFTRRGVPGRGGRFAGSYCSDALWGVSNLLVRVNHQEVLMQCHRCIHTHSPSSLHLVHQIFFCCDCPSGL